MSWFHIGIKTFNVFHLCRSITSLIFSHFSILSHIISHFGTLFSALSILYNTFLYWQWVIKLSTFLLPNFFKFFSLFRTVSHFLWFHTLVHYICISNCNAILQYFRFFHTLCTFLIFLVFYIVLYYFTFFTY